MRVPPDLTATLLAAQRDAHLHELAQVELATGGVTTHTYGPSRIRSISHIEQPYSHTATVVLENNDTNVVTNFMGYTAYVSYGLTTSVGDEYSLCAPLTVRDSHWYSTPNRLLWVGYLWGIPNLLELDLATNAYICASTNTDTLQTHINNILSTFTGAGAVYGGCTSYTGLVDWGTLDSVMNVLVLADHFRIYRGESRLSVIRRLLGYTKMEMRVRGTGHINFYVPATYSYPGDAEFRIETSGYQDFIQKYKKSSLVIPNYIEVIEPGTSGTGAVKTQAAAGVGSIALKSLTVGLGWCYQGALMTIAGDSTTYTLTGTTQIITQEATVFFTPALAQIAHVDDVVTISESALYYGYAEDTASSAKIKKAQQVFLPIASDAQATTTAEAILAKYKLYSSAGSVLARQHCGLETGDTVNAYDSREADNVFGNVGYIHRTYSPNGSFIFMRLGNEELGGALNIRSLFSGSGDMSTPEDIYNWASDKFANLYRTISEGKTYQEQVGTHHASHQDGGADEVDVTGLVGIPSDEHIAGIAMVMGG